MLHNFYSIYSQRCHYPKQGCHTSLLICVSRVFREWYTNMYFLDFKIHYTSPQDTDLHHFCTSQSVSHFLQTSDHISFNTTSIRYLFTPQNISLIQQFMIVYLVNVISHEIVGNDSKLYTRFIHLTFVNHSRWRHPYLSMFNHLINTDASHGLTTVSSNGRRGSRLY